ncbi:heavy-metal-associated domain-containing protein [Rufibacter psychrotolerans]|uniref:heavy-metal-associated domain-containing protein n=1 Tax=Rufibacter psychrotolerans TaxID=2812556 RepID=UPI001967AD57|nr:heavy-metal-associated domain-containing protein [Rufibacter sp. SYSU D00308]
MKTLKIWMLSLVLTGVTFAGFAQGGKKGEEVKFKTSAVCGMCKATLEKGLAYEKGVEKATLDVDSKILTVTYNGQKTSVEKLKKAVNDLGYDADNAPATPRAYDRLDACCKKDAASHH